MPMRMMDEGLAPGVEHGDEADLRAKMPRVGGDGVEGLGRRLKQDVVNGCFVVTRERSDRLGDGEDDVEVFAVEQFGRALLDPRGAGERLALGTVAITAGVVGDALVSARVTRLDMSTASGRAARFDGGHHPPLRGRE